MTMSDSAAGPDVSDGEEQRPGYDIRFLDDAGMQKLGYQIAYWKYGRAYLAPLNDECTECRTKDRECLTGPFRVDPKDMYLCRPACLSCASHKCSSSKTYYARDPPLRCLGRGKPKPPPRRRGRPRKVTLLALPGPAEGEEGVGDESMMDESVPTPTPAPAPASASASAFSPMAAAQRPVPIRVAGSETSQPPARTAPQRAATSASMGSPAAAGSSSSARGSASASDPPEPPARGTARARRQATVSLDYQPAAAGHSTAEPARATRKRARSPSSPPRRRKSAPGGATNGSTETPPMRVQAAAARPSLPGQVIPTERDASVDMSAEFAEEDSEEKDDYEDKDNYDEDDEDDDNDDYDDGDSGGSLGNGFANDSYDETMHDDSGNTDPDGALEPTNDLLPHSSSNMTSAKAKAGDQCLRDQSLRDLLALQQIEAFAARRAHLTLAAETASAALSSLVRKAEAYADGDALLSTWRDVELSPVVRVALENAIGSHKRTHARVVELERLLLPASRELRGLARLDPSA